MKFIEIALWIVNLLLFILLITVLSPNPSCADEATKCETLLNKCNAIAWQTVNGNATMHDLANCDAKFEKACQ